MTPEEALDKAKVHLLMKKGTLFLSSVSMLLKHELSTEVPTAATDGTTVLYNPSFLLSLSPEERLGLLAHEVWHVAMLHMVRIGNNEPLVWNMAGDYVINLLLTENGFVLPEGALLDHKFTGMSTEQVYEYLIQNQDQQPQSFNQDLMEREPTEADKQKLTDIVLRATQRTKLVDSNGKIPQEVIRTIEDLINPRLSWSDVLYRYLDSRIKQNYSWTKPNRRYLPDWYLPSNSTQSISNLTIAIDTSGSIDDELLQAILSEIDYINKTLKPEKLVIIDCDYRIHNVYEIDNYQDIMDLKFTGKGGTNFNPVIKYCEDHDTNLLVYFTDLYGPNIYTEPSYPVLWVCYSDHAPATIGETIYANI